MGMKIVASDLLYIVQIANRSGCMAVIDDHAVAIFTPVCHEVDEGFHHVGFRIDHAQTVAEAQMILRKDRRQLREAAA